MTNNIDLSALDALKLPSREIEVSILGKIQKITVSAYGDDAYLDFSSFRRNDSDHENRKTWKYILVRCAGFTEEQADKLLVFDGKAASAIIDVAVELSEAFDDERKKIRDEAEKNSGAAAVTDTNA
ncbi:MAG: hypothetical protein MJ016_00955 [Victivallaceae bacterium]|nr:hypothetical protein [Victivallaceae bacterium]